MLRGLAIERTLAARISWRMACTGWARDEGFDTLDRTQAERTDVLLPRPSHPSDLDRRRTYPARRRDQRRRSVLARARRESNSRAVLRSLRPRGALRRD